ncbi:GGDEF domain-containing protein [Paucidesulfovibrio longus]|uniref:GGDEF domain-containing protein n=1 Tax=Paucidesulfovibrio longus TaxID=889 RepID=UPI0003B6C9BA|nr:GGDEF domain-containing protein [Paucidesulfovibrio longus]
MPTSLKSRAEEWDRLIARLDKAGVPPDVRWRTLILYMRNVRGFYFLSERQKSEIQQLIVDTLKARDYTDRHYEEVVKRQEEILLGPHKEKLRMTLDESEGLLRDFRDLMLRKKGDVQELEVLTVGLVESEKSPKEMISAMRKAFHEVVHAMETDMADLTRISMTDALTQLYNRRAFDEHLSASAEACVQAGQPLSLIMIDIDHFKRFNDTYGHRIGDQALRVVAKVLLLHGEEVNGRPDAGRKGRYFPARYGGEEFAVVLNRTPLEEAAQMGETIRSRVEHYNFTIQDNSGNVLHEGVRITVSVGVARLDPAWKGAWAENLLEHADKHLYQAKESGRNKVCCVLEE